MQHNTANKITVKLYGTATKRGFWPNRVTLVVPRFSSKTSTRPLMLTFFEIVYEAFPLTAFVELMKLETVQRIPMS